MPAAAGFFAPFGAFGDKMQQVVRDNEGRVPSTARLPEYLKSQIEIYRKSAKDALLCEAKSSSLPPNKVNNLDPLYGAFSVNQGIKLLYAMFDQSMPDK